MEPDFVPSCLPVESQVFRTPSCSFLLGVHSFYFLAHRKPRGKEGQQDGKEKVLGSFM